MIFARQKLYANIIAVNGAQSSSGDILANAAGENAHERWTR
jgi:hypothetical protein